MKIKVSYGKTKNLGNYESLRLDCSVEQDIVIGTIKSHFHQLYDELVDLVESKLKELKE